MTDRTLDEVLDVARSGLGTWWPNPWWPTGASSHNDCMAFVSWALYGLNGRQPFYTYVPHIMDRAIREGRWHGGKALTKRPTDQRYADGIRAGDVVIFDWRFVGSRDHVGIALGAPKDGGIRVRQANNGGGGTGRGGVRDPAEDITYGTQFVLGYYRPPYRSSAPAGGNTSPIGDDDMALSREVQAQLDRIEQRAQWAADYVAVGEADKRPDGQLALMVREARDAARLAAQRAGWAADYTRVEQFDANGKSDGVRDGAMAQLMRRILQRATWAADYARVDQGDGVSDGALARLIRRIATPKAFAAEIAPLLQVDLTKLSDADVARLATASADEIDRRGRKRLGS